MVFMGGDRYSDRNMTGKLEHIKINYCFTSD